jgi:hypothetical protein
MVQADATNRPAEVGMNIVLEPEAKDWLLARGGSATIEPLGGG